MSCKCQNSRETVVVDVDLNLSRVEKKIAELRSLLDSTAGLGMCASHAVGHFFKPLGMNQIYCENCGVIKSSYVYSGVSTTGSFPLYRNNLPGAPTSQSY